MESEPARSVAGGKEDVGGKVQGSSAHLGVVGGGRRKRLHGGAEAAEGFIQVRRAPASSGRRG